MNIINKIKAFTQSHRRLSAILAVVLILVIYFGYQKFQTPAAATSYVLGTVTRDTLVTTVSGTGQVSNSNQIDLKAKVSGDVVAIKVEDGQKVKTNDLLIQLNAQDVQKAVRDAQANLESAKISLAKLQQPADNLSLLQAQNSLAQAQQNKQNVQDDLQKTYDDGFNSIANAFLDLPTAITGLHDILFGTTAGNGGQDNASYFADTVKTYNYSDAKITDYKNAAIDSYQTARAKYDQNFEDYKATSRFADRTSVESLINETYDTTKILADAIKNAYNLIQYYEDKVIEQNKRPSSVADAGLNSLNNYTGKTNTHLADLLSTQKTIQSDKDALINADQSIAEKTASLAKLQTGADPLDIQSQQLSVQQRQNALTDAQEKYADYFIRAPFDGIIAKVDIKKTDSVSSGTTIATLITEQQIAEISLNEVDAAKVKIGEKATLTFDAIDGLTMAGTVIDMDSIGTVSQGVVTYMIKIGFASEDDRVKSGMSVSANIITNVKSDVLIVPSSAIKQQGSGYYVEVFDQKLTPATGTQSITSPTLPSQKTVTIGLANDTDTEIVSGLNENDQIITRTIIAAVASTKTTTQAPSLFGGAATRIGR